MAFQVALGINAHVGYAEEVTYGTWVAPTNFLNTTSESMKLTQPYTPITVLGNSYHQNYVNGKRSVGGGVDFPADFNRSTAIWFKHALGNVVSTAVSGNASAYNHYITASGTVPTALSLYVDRDANTIGTAYGYAGCNVSDIKITIDTDAVVKGAVTLVGQNEQNVSYVNPSGIANPHFITWDETFVPTLTSSGVAVFSGVQIHSLEIDIKNSLNENRYSLGQVTKTGLGLGGVRSVEGSMVIEFSQSSQYGYFQNGNEISGNFALTGPLISGSAYYSMNIDLPRMKITGDTPVAGSEGELTMTVPFTCYQDYLGTGKLLSVGFTNTDSTIH